MTIQNLIDKLSIALGEQGIFKITESHISVSLDENEYRFFNKWSVEKSYRYHQEVIDQLKLIPNFQFHYDLSSNNLWYQWIDTKKIKYELRIHTKGNCNPILCLFWLRLFPPWEYKFQRQSLRKIHKQVLSERQDLSAL